MRPALRLSIGILAAVLPANAATYTFEQGQEFLKTYCRKCHDGKSAVGGFALQRVNAPASLRAEARKWTSAANRVHAGEMPPKGAPAPDVDTSEQFTQWVRTAVRAEVCAAGVTAGPAPIRRLNRDEYTATLRDLFDIHLDVGGTLPADGAGGEGFDNAAETLFLSPLHSEKYLETAKFALDFAAKEYKSRAKIFVAQPGPGISADQAARDILRSVLPRAFRRPVAEADVASYLALYQQARRQGQDFEPAVLFALRAALVSPRFLFRTEPRNDTPQQRLLDSYSMASRLSYFLWGSMPDELLFDIAEAGKLHDPEVLRQLIPRMLRNDRALGFAQRFIEQWLHTRELSGDKAPDAKLFPAYAGDEELRSDIRLQPVLFFREVFMQNFSLLDFLDSKGTIGTSNLSKHYGVKLPVRQNASKQPQWVEVPAGSNRGGLLGMGAILTVTSYPYRTSPVLRGAWILDSLLGTPPPPPPPNVPTLEEHKEGAAPRTMRERLAQHRENPACAGCHSRMDGLGFALENYDVLGRWRDDEGGKPIDNSGELADRTTFRGPAELKRVLLDRKDLFLRNLTSKMLGYALGRGLTLQDSCTVDQIAARVKDNNYSAQKLIEEIVLSVPFRYQGGSQTR